MNRRCGFSLFEIALAAVLLAGALALAAGAYQHLVTRARAADTRKLLLHLRRAATSLDEDTSIALLATTEAQEVFDGLCREPAAAAAMQDVSPHLWRCRDGKARCADGWGSPLRVITRGTTEPALAHRLQLAGCSIIFESAGPDRDFGDLLPMQQTDNIRSDDPSATLDE